MWKQKLNEASYDYENSQGAVVANVSMVGIKGRWRWSCASFAVTKIDRGCFGTKATLKEARLAAEDFLRGKSAL